MSRQCDDSQYVSIGWVCIAGLFGWFAGIIAGVVLVR